MIYGKIADIMMTSEMRFSLNEKAQTTMTISEETWVELRDCIQEAIEYYYNEKNIAKLS